DAHELLIGDKPDTGFIEHVAEDSRRGAWLEQPGFALGVLVIAAQAAIELAGNPADGGFIAKVGAAEAAAGQSANMRVERRKDDGSSQSPRSHRRGDACRRGTVDADVGPNDLGGFGALDRL